MYIHVLSHAHVASSRHVSRGAAGCVELNLRAVALGTGSSYTVAPARSHTAKCDIDKNKISKSTRFSCTLLPKAKPNFLNLTLNQNLSQLSITYTYTCIRNRNANAIQLRPVTD